MTTYDTARERLRQAKEVSLLGLIKDLGYELDSTGSYYSMLSPFRSEGKGSFKISKKRPDKWRDHGNGKHGDICDFVKELFGYSHREAVNYLLGKRNIPVPAYEPIKQDTNPIEIKAVEPLSHPRLIEYLTERKIGLNQAKRYLKQARISFVNGKNPQREYIVLAFENNSGGYEFRNAFFKISSSPKDVTNINEHTNSINERMLYVFEGFTDFLSQLTLMDVEVLPHKAVILNSASFINVLAPMLKNNFVMNMGHNDDAGDQVVRVLTENRIVFDDARTSYPEYNDINDYLMGKKKPIKKKRVSIKSILS